MAGRTMSPTVYSLSKRETDATDDTKVGDELVSGTVIRIKTDGVEVCYTKQYKECGICTRTECPFSGYKER